MKEIMLTTVDNPWNPFQNFNEWYSWDMAHGYDTCGVVARLSTKSQELSQEINEEFLENAIFDLIDADPIGLYTVISEKDTPNPVNVFEEKTKIS